MRTRAPTSADSVAGAVVTSSTVPDESAVKFIQALCALSLGRAASGQEVRELCEFMNKGGRSLAVHSVLMMEESLIRLAGPWFWKLLSRGPSEKEITEFVGSVRSGTPFDAAISRVVGSEQYIQRASKRSIGADGEAHLLQSIHIDLLGRLADSDEAPRLLKQIRTVGCARYALGILRSPEFRRDYVVRLHHEVLDRTPAAAEMDGWLKRENLGLDLLAVRQQLLTGEDYFRRCQRANNSTQKPGGVASPAWE
jgi:hypothetical protein